VEAVWWGTRGGSILLVAVLPLSQGTPEQRGQKVIIAVTFAADQAVAGMTPAVYLM
jgi:hypothetical protein